MEKIILNAVITGGKDHFATWFKDVPGVYGAGDTVEKAKQSLFNGIELLGEDAPDVLKGDFEIIFTFDLAGLLKYYSKFISFAGISELTGINQKTIWSYSIGYRNPKKETSEKILKALNALGKELSQVQITI